MFFYIKWQRKEKQGKQLEELQKKLLEGLQEELQEKLWGEQLEKQLEGLQEELQKGLLERKEGSSVRRVVNKRGVYSFCRGELFYYTNIYIS